MDIFKDKGYIDLIRIKVAHPRGVPAYIENVDLEELVKSAETVTSNQYGDPITMEYPLHTKEATWLSAAYFAKDNADNFNAISPKNKYVMDRIKEASYLWGIEEDVNNIINTIVNPPKQKVAEVWGWEENGKKHYPLHDRELVKMAMDYFKENRDHYTRTKRVKVAQAIYKQAVKMGVDVSDSVRKEAGAGYPDRAAIVQTLNERSNVTHASAPIESKVYAEIATKIANAPTEELFAEASNAVAAVERLDKEAGLHYNYIKGSDKCVVRPVDSFYAMTQKEASEEAYRYVTLGGNTLDCVKIAEHVPVSEFDTPFYKGFFQDKYKELVKAGSIAKDTSDATAVSKVINSLSRSDKYLLLNHLASV